MELLDQAIHFAVKAHKGMLRKVTKTPYIVHPMEVLTIADTLTKDEEVLAAAVLHDTVEDTDVTLDQIRIFFGDRVYRIVAAESENKRKGQDPHDTWRIRKEETINHLKETEDIGVKIVCLADKLANIRSFYRLYTIEGDAVWSHTNTSNPKDHEWYYRSLGECMSVLNHSSAYQEYMAYLDLLFSAHKG